MSENSELEVEGGLLEDAYTEIENRASNYFSSMQLWDMEKASNSQPADAEGTAVPEETFSSEQAAEDYINSMVESRGGCTEINIFRIDGNCEINVQGYVCDNGDYFISSFIQCKVGENSWTVKGGIFQLDTA